MAQWEPWKSTLSTIAEEEQRCVVPAGGDGVGTEGGQPGGQAPADSAMEFFCLSSVAS